MNLISMFFAQQIKDRCNFTATASNTPTHTARLATTPSSTKKDSYKEVKAMLTQLNNTWYMGQDAWKTLLEWEESIKEKHPDISFCKFFLETRAKKQPPRHKSSSGTEMKQYSNDAARANLSSITETQGQASPSSSSSSESHTSSGSSVNSNDSSSEIDEQDLVSSFNTYAEIFSTQRQGNSVATWTVSKANLEWITRLCAGITGGLYSISDGGADTCILGEGWTALCTYEKKVSILGYDEHTTKKHGCPVVNAATVYTDADGNSFLAIVNHGILNSNSNTTLLSEF